MFSCLILGGLNLHKQHLWDQSPPRLRFSEASGAVVPVARSPTVASGPILCLAACQHDGSTFVITGGSAAHLGVWSIATGAGFAPGSQTHTSWQPLKTISPLFSLFFCVAEGMQS